MNCDQLLTSYDYRSCFGNTSEQHAKTQSLDNIKSEFNQQATNNFVAAAPHSTDSLYPPGYPNILDVNSNWGMPCYHAANETSAKSLHSELSSLLPPPPPYNHGPLTEQSADSSEDNHRFSFLNSQAAVDSSMLAAHPTYLPSYSAPSTYQELLDSSGVSATSSSFTYPFTSTIPREAQAHQSGMFHFAVHPFSNYYSQSSRTFSLPESSGGGVQDSLNSSLSSLDSTANALDVAAGKHSNKAAQMSQSNKPKRKRIATVAQRRAANIRERRRMFSLNESFDSLRKKVPTFAYEKRLSRIETLRLAITYIAFMTDLLQGKQPQQIRLVSRKSNNLLCQVAQQHLFNQQNCGPLILTSPSQSEPSTLPPSS